MAPIVKTCMVRVGVLTLRSVWSFLALVVAGLAAAVGRADDGVLPNTRPLKMEGDIADALVSGVDRFLLIETAESVERRSGFWRRDLTSPEAFRASIQPNVRRLAHVLGVRDERVPFNAPEVLQTPDGPRHAAEGARFTATAVTWPVFEGIHAEGLLLRPKDGEPAAYVVAIPDAGQMPEDLVAAPMPLSAGAEGGIRPMADPSTEPPATTQFARMLAEAGCEVLVPVLIDRTVEKRRRVELPNREWAYRLLFQLGRTPTGLEVQKVLAAVDWFAGRELRRPVGIIGYGEGGRVALFAAALDERIAAACVSGYFDAREDLWQEPLDRNLFGLLREFGDAEVAAMLAPRKLVVEASRGPEIVVPTGTAAGPGRLVTPPIERVRTEVMRAQAIVGGFQPAPRIALIESDGGGGPGGSGAALEALLSGLGVSQRARPAEAQAPPPAGLAWHTGYDPAARQRRQLREIERYSEWLWLGCEEVRRQFFAKLDSSSLERHAETVQRYRDYFDTEVIGRFDRDLLPPDVRTRKVYDQPGWTGYEVVMDVFPDVIAYGLLLLPKGIGPGERRPVVVCQHGLEGRPQNVVEGDSRAYINYGALLADRGFIVFAPQNLYLFRDRFRTLQRKANPLGKTLFSVIVPQHRQMTDWLKTLPQVDPERIGFYGISYGGKTAMRVPPLVPNYCLSICSADFAEWIWKNTSQRFPSGYLFTGEYEIWEYNLGNTFNYAEMAAMIAPRPFMVERGHFDGVAPDEAVAYEYAKVRRLYAAQLGIPERTEIEWFVGPHAIHGVGTFEFLHRHLRWPKPQGEPQ
ncbi:MAG: dienelactone hydrolase family protein [Thermoguttaceae bacterium]|jgi:dienelactone hydrolase|nr:dienelactone hydrolase family protein [Thermoguttaceae bacterium]